MGLICKIKGHDWDGCTCRRCGKNRATNAASDHVYKHNRETCFMICSKCGHTVPAHTWNGCKCQVCGASRSEQHDWNGCTCSICGSIRDSGHKWLPDSPIHSTRDTHLMKCSVCGKTERRIHTFELKEKCIEVCKVCGFQRGSHQFVNGICSNCGTDQNDYYCDLIASGEVDYYDHDSDSGRNTFFGDFVTAVPAQKRLLTLLVLSGRYHVEVPCKRIIKNLTAISRSDSCDASDADRSLYEIVEDEKIYLYLRKLAFDGIQDSHLRSKADNILREWGKQHPVSEAEIERRNLLIESDSGMGTSG